MWFGGKIVDGFCEVFDEYFVVWCCGVLVVIGCVFWLSSEVVVEMLFVLSVFCVVIDKGILFLL